MPPFLYVEDLFTQRIFFIQLIFFIADPPLLPDYHLSTAICHYVPTFSLNHIGFGNQNQINKAKIKHNSGYSSPTP
jgi:hypothetical protein